MCLAIRHIKKLEQECIAIEMDFKKMSQKNSEIDNKIIKMYHEIETKRYDVFRGYKQLKDLQELLQQRRVIKYEISQLDRLMSMTKEVKKKINKLNGRFQDSENSIAKYTSNWSVPIKEILESK